MGDFKLEKDIGESGLTLVEILAALVILTIVFISFFTFFTQSATFTKHNKEKLTAVQVAEDVVAEVRKGTYQNNPVESIKKGDYEVGIVITAGPAGLGLKKAEITVTPPPGTGIKNISFVTEMYFDGDGEVTPP